MRIALFLLCAATLLLLLRFVPAVLAGFAGAIFLPFATVLGVAYDAAVAVPNLLASDTSLRAEIRDLEESLAAHGAAATRAAYLRAENEALRAQLGATTASTTIAGVIAQPPVLPYDVLVIDRGEADGIRENAPVYASADIVVGFVARTFAHRSVVQLATMPGVTATAYVYGPDVYATARGQGGGVMRVSVPQGVPLARGDVVALPALTGGAFGQIEYVDSVPERPAQYGYVPSPISLQSLRFVRVGARPLTSLSFAEAEAAISSTAESLLTVPVPARARAPLATSSQPAATSTATSSPPE